MSQKKIKILSWALIVFFLIPLLGEAVYVFAQGGYVFDRPPDTIVSREGKSGLIKVINFSRNWILGLIVFTAVVFILLSAFNMITSGGDEAKFKKARKMLINTIIGLVVALFAAAIIYILLDILDSASETGGGGGNNNPTSLRGVNEPCEYNYQCASGNCLSIGKCGP